MTLHDKLIQLADGNVGRSRNLALAAACMALDEAAKACDDERVDAAATGEESDRAYNAACQHCEQACLRMAVQLGDDRSGR